MPQVNGLFLRDRREELDLSARDVATGCNCAEGTVWNIEGEKSKYASRRLLHRIVRLLNEVLRERQSAGHLAHLEAVTIHDLIANDDDDESEPAKKKNERETSGAGTGPKDNRPPTKDAADRIAS